MSGIRARHTAHNTFFWLRFMINDHYALKHTISPEELGLPVALVHGVQPDPRLWITESVQKIREPHLSQLVSSGGQSREARIGSLAVASRLVPSDLWWLDTNYEVAMFAEQQPVTLSALQCATWEIIVKRFLGYN